MGAGFSIAPGFTGTLRLSHRGSDTQFDLPLTIDANGIGETEWAAPQGRADGRLRHPGDRRRTATTTYTDQSFKVDEYKLPTMRATVTGPKDAAVRPKSLPLDLFVGYLSGGGASNLPVEMRVGYFGRSATPDGYDGYTFGGTEVKEGTKPLNGDGEEEDDAAAADPDACPRRSAPTARRGSSVDVPTLDSPTDMLVEMDYQDANGEMLTASKRIPIFPSAVQLGVKTDGWLMKQDDLRLNFVALDTDGKPRKGQNDPGRAVQPPDPDRAAAADRRVLRLRQPDEDRADFGDVLGDDRLARPRQMRDQSRRVGRSLYRRDDDRRQRQRRARGAVGVAGGRRRLVVRRRQWRPHGRRPRKADLQGRRDRAVPGADAVPRGRGAGHGRARGRAVELRHQAVGGEPGGRGARCRGATRPTSMSR